MRGGHGSAESSRASAMPLPSGSPTSTSAAVGRRASRDGAGLGHAGGLPDDLEPAGGEHAPREPAEDGVVVDEEDGRACARSWQRARGRRVGLTRHATAPGG